VTSDNDPKIARIRELERRIGAPVRRTRFTGHLVVNAGDHSMAA
jgi:hypothetical protein